MDILLSTSDITQLPVDGIVNAANNTLLGGGGVDGAINRAAGAELLAECRTLNGCATGEAKITRGYRLPASYVLHTVGPIWNGGQAGEPEQLRNCYLNTLELAREYALPHLAYPAISTGVYGYPKDQACAIAVETVSLWSAPYPNTVTFCCFDEETKTLYEKALYGAL